MAVHQVDLIRRYTLRKLKELRIFMSMLPISEHEAIGALSGPEGVKTAARIADFVLEQLGHKPPAEANGTSPTVRAARQALNPRI